MGLRQRRQRFVRAHGADGFRPVLRHGQNHVPQILPGIMEGLAERFPVRIRLRKRRFFRHGQILQADQAAHPFPVRVQGRKALFERFAFRQRPGAQVGFQHVAGFQLPAPQDMGVFLKQHPRFGGQDQPLVVRQGAAQRAQAVPVQRRAHRVSVGIQDGRRSVPWLHHGGVIAVQVPPGRIPLLALPGFGQQNHARQGQGEAVHGKEFQGVVQHLAVAAALRNHGQHPRHFRAHEVRAHGFFPGLHAVMIAPDGVDFPVVQQHSLRVRLAPGGEGVGGKPGMHHGHLGAVAHVLQIVIEGTKLADQHHALIDNGAAGERTNIGVRVLLFKYPAQNIEPPVKILPGGDRRGTLQKALADAGHGAPRPGPQLGGVAGHVPPAQNGNGFGGGQLLENAADVAHPHLVLRQKKHAHAVVAGAAQGNAFLLCPGGEQGVGKLGHDAHAVARGAQSVAARPVGQALHNGKRLVYGAVGGFAA